MNDYHFAWAYTYMGIQKVRVVMQNDTEAAVIWESCGLHATFVPKSQVFAEECIKLMDRLVVAEDVTHDTQQ